LVTLKEVGTMSVRYLVTLTPEEREQLEALTKKGKHASRMVLLARALLLCDTSQPDSPWQTADIVKALGISSRTVERLKKRFVEDGLDQALERKVVDTSTREVKFDGAFEARLIALACSEAPRGRSRWTVRLLAEKAVELNIIDTVSPMTIQRTLKKTNLNLTKRSIGKSPQKRTGAL
jgi:transposase